MESKLNIIELKAPVRGHCDECGGKLRGIETLTCDICALVQPMEVALGEELKDMNEWEFVMNPDEDVTISEPNKVYSTVNNLLVYSKNLVKSTLP